MEHAVRNIVQKKVDGSIGQISRVNYLTEER
jgi:hypothetical protein